MKKTRVLAAMSGGVDSSVAAGLLKEQGYEVIGVTLQLWKENGDSLSGAQTSYGKEAADKLGIPHYRLNAAKIFKEKVIDDFCREYRRGRTPNPCIRCNQYIKFDYLLKKAGQFGAAFLSTGHYAKVEYNSQENKYLLKKGRDLNKDQSYFLYRLSQKQLKKILLPLGNWTKAAVRKKAKKLGLSLKTEESREICFVPGKNYGIFLKKSMPGIIQPGPILNSRGKTLAGHSGIAFYTIGQRKGLGISSREPLYVTAIDSKTNSVFVGPEKELYRQRLIAKALNWISINKLSEDLGVRAKIRYLHKEAEAKLILRRGKTALLEFKKAQRAVTPGQAVVFYQGDVVAGGGIIK